MLLPVWLAAGYARRAEVKGPLPEEQVMSVRYMDTIARRYVQLGYQPYRWFEADAPAAFTPLARPLSELTLASLRDQLALVSQDIVDRIGQVPELRFTPQGTWEVKGREHPVTVYSVEAQSDCNPPEPNSTGHEYVDATDDR